MNTCGLVTFALTVFLSFCFVQTKALQKTTCEGKTKTLACQQEIALLNKMYHRLQSIAITCRNKKATKDETIKCRKVKDILSKIKKTCKNSNTCRNNILRRRLEALCSEKIPYLFLENICPKDKPDIPTLRHTLRQCGVPDIKPGDTTLLKIVGGAQAIPHSWPWAVQLRVDKQGDGKHDHECGAALITPSFALTARHCFIASNSDANKWKAVAGRHNKDEPEINNQIRKISKIILFPNPTGNILDRDIALIKFDEPLEINKYVSPVCLPTKEPELGDLCTVVGWGDTHETGFDDVLKQARMPVVSRKTCNETEGLAGKITPYMICSGWKKGEHDACQGDSGGPFVCQYGNTYHLQGVVSWGSECAKPNLPGVYGNVFKVVSWVKKQISKNS